MIKNKIILLMFVFVVFSTTVFGNSLGQLVKNQDGKLGVLPSMAEDNVAQQQRLQLEQQERIMTQETLQEIGLENAQLRVKNNETRQLLEQVWERIQERDRQRIENLSNLEIEDNLGNRTVPNIEFKGKTQAKFLGLFNVDHTIRYVVDESGNMMKRNGLFDFMFSEI